jgi:signal transduction histidine kinase
MKLTAFITATFCVLCALKSTAQLKKDSLFLEEAFTGIIVTPEKEDSLLAIAYEIFSTDNDTLADYLDFIRAKFLFRTGQLENAFILIEKRINHPFNTGQNDGKYHNLKGAIYSLQNKNRDAINEFINASRKYEQNGNLLRAALLKNNIANIYFSLNRHEKAYEYLTDCFNVLKAYPENEYYPQILGTLAISAALTQRFNEAETYANMGHTAAIKANDSIAMAIINYAKGEIALSQNDLDRSLSYLKISISIAQQFNLFQYRLLAEILMMKTYNLQGDFGNAITVGERALAIAKRLPNKTTFIAIHRGLQEAYRQRGDYRNAFYHLQQLDSIQVITRNESIAARTDSLLIAFESEKKDMALVMKDLELEQVDEKVRNQQLFVAVLLLILIAILGFVILYIRTKKTQLLELELKREKELLSAAIDGERKERIRISSELHDGVSAELTALKIQLSNEQQDPSIIEQISTIQRDVRRMAHSLSPIKLEYLGIIKALREHCQQVSTSSTAVHFSTNIEDKTIQWKETAMHIVFRTLQELIQNALKHASANHIDVQFLLHKDSNTLRISVEDDGVGFDPSNITVNTQGKERVDKLGGEMNYDSKPGAGTTVMIHLKRKDIEH